MTPATGGTKLTQTGDKKNGGFVNARLQRASNLSDDDEGCDGGDADEFAETFRPRYTPIIHSTCDKTSPSPSKPIK